MVDFLYIGYDNVEDDMPTLMVARKTKGLGQSISNTEILKQFTGEAAIDIYKLLTENKIQ